MAVHAPARWCGDGIAIAPSVLAADFGRLAEEVARVAAGGADLLHVDVMDGHFVPNLTLGPGIVQVLRRESALPLDVHMMVTDPLAFVDPFCDAGADSVSFHVETSGDPRAVIAAIRARGRRVGLAVNPGTGLDAVWPLLDEIDLLLCMTVHPGFGGQSFMPHVLDKVRAVRARHPALPIEVDGGLAAGTVGPAVEAGATLIVAGTAVFGAPDAAVAIATLRATAEAAVA